MPDNQTQDEVGAGRRGRRGISRFLRWFRSRSARRAGLALVIGGLIGSGVSGGWWLRGRIEDRPVVDVDVSVDRPIVEVADDVEIAGMPNLLGLSEEQARRVLVDAGVGDDRVDIVEIPSAGEPGLVVNQAPTPGVELVGRATLGLSIVATVPDLVGKPETDARDALGGLGARVILQRVFDPNADEGVVTAVSPAPGENLPDEVTLTVAGAPSSAFLTVLDDVESTCSDGPATVNAQELAESLTCTVDEDDTDVVEYLLNRRVARVEATLGQSDRGPTGGTLVFRFYADDALVGEHSVGYGEAVPVSIAVEGKLRFRVEIVQPEGQDLSRDPVAVIGDGRVVGAPDAIDALVAESN